PIFNMFRKVILIDRTPPAVALAAPAPGSAITTGTYAIAVRCTDRTADRMHFFLDPAPGTDLVGLAEGGQGVATQSDRDLFVRTFAGLTAGMHRLGVVAYEPT